MQRYTLDDNHIALSKNGEPVEERLIEFERKVPFKGFAAAHLFPNEPNLKFKRWDGDSWSGLALSAKEDLMLPTGWTWIESDWSVLVGSRANANGTDADGWMYAFNWTEENSYTASGGMTDCVRRRVWVRRRARAADAVLQASGSPLPDVEKVDEGRSTLIPVPVPETVGEFDSEVRDLFEKNGLSDIAARICEELGANLVSDLRLVESEDVDALTWLKPIQRRKLLKLIADTQV